LRVAFALSVLAFALVLTASASGLSTRGWAPQKSSAANLAATADPDQITFELDGCRNTGSITLPNGNGDFICADSDYTSGNLAKAWNELDLVPFRVSLTNKAADQTYIFVVAGDYKNGAGTGPGWDVISELTLHASLSSASCPVHPTMGATTITPSGGGAGGADQTIYRSVTLTQLANTTCVYDYYQRLALGAHDFNGSSLQVNLWNQNLGTQGIGQKRVSLPNNPSSSPAPQALNKDMTATQGSDHVWTIKKEPTPAHVDFANTCDTSASLSAAVSVKVTWERLAASPSGVITVVTHVYATNPSSRVVTLNLTDDIRTGTTVLDTATAGPTDLPANTNTLILTHTTTVPSGTTNLNDVATGTYTDKVTGVPIPGTTTATASAPVQLTGPEKDQTATIDDVEDITGSGLSYSADSFSGASGAFDLGYVAGTHTTGSVSWTSVSQSGGSSVTFSKTIYATGGTSGNGDLSDTATVTGSDGFSADADADITVTTDAKVKLTINKTIPNVLQGSETETFNFEVYDSSNVLVASPTISFAATDTSKSVDVTNLAPGTYTVKETGSTSGKWTLQADKVKTISLPSCSGSVSFANAFGPAAAKVKKVTLPAGSESGWEMTLTGPGTIPVSGEKVTTTGTGFVSFLTSLQEGSYTITETGQTGWDQTGSSTECSFTVNYPADSGRVFECTKTNTQRGKIIVQKVTDPNPDPTDTSFSFTAGGGLSPTSFSLKNGGTKTYSSLTPGNGYNVAETVPTGWDLTTSTCDDGSPVTNIDVAAGETVTCTFTNTLKRAKIIVKKVTNPSPDTTDTSFAFTAGGGLSPTSFSLKNGATQEFSNLLPGNTYNAAETVPTGWDLTSSTCDDGSPVTAIDVAAGETVTCTFTNRQKGKIIIKKVTNPSPDTTDTSFAFTAGGGLSPTSFSLKNGATKEFANLTPGSGYNAAETVTTGWDLTSSTCDDSSPVTNIDVAAGETVTCTFTNRQKGKIIIKKVTNPSPDPTNKSFSFTAGGGLSPNSFSLGNGGMQTYSNVTPGSGYSAAETVPDGWDLTSSTCDDGSPVSNINVAAGETVTCTFTNRARAKAKVVKTVSGGALGTQSFVFQLRSGASANAAGTTLESGTANAGNGGVITFTTLLVPGTTYQLCEQMQPGWTTTLGPPLYSVFNPSGDNSVVCTDFTASAGETKQFAIDNRPPPGGMALTIGYWKNWSSCTGGGQKPTLDATLLKLAQAGTPATLGLLVLNPQTQSAATVCQNAVNILSKQTLGGKKMASDPLFNMAAQLLAADLNLGAGAGQCAASATAVNQGHALLTKYKFDGNGYTPKLTSADSSLANSLGTTLDKYNNNKLC
jgi:hypothetical protein